MTSWFLVLPLLSPKSLCFCRAFLSEMCGSSASREHSRDEVSMKLGQPNLENSAESGLHELDLTSYVFAV